MNNWELLKPLSGLYDKVTGLRNNLYNEFALIPLPSESTVISVGGLSAGGSGKTPLTIALAKRILGRFPGKKAAIVSRGYGRVGRGVRIVADREGVLLGPEVGGDEPVMMARQLPGVPVIVAEKRIRGAEEAVRTYDADIILLDDAFQHRGIFRDLDIVLLDAAMPAWHRLLLPAGRLREHPGNLQRADLVVIRESQNVSQNDQILSWCRKFTNAPILKGRLSSVSVTELTTGKTLSLESVRDAEVAAYCGIAHPSSFVRALKNLGATIRKETVLPDHGRMSRNQQKGYLDSVEQLGVQAVVMTAKDAVKWTEYRPGVPLWILNVEWEWSENEEILDQQLSACIESAFEGKA